jgi:hypothetical protein
MTSPEKVAANQRNAAYSTGPRTESGKARSKRNSLRHGLAAKLHTTGHVSQEIKHLAAAIVGPDPDPSRLHFAIVAAEAEFELRRVRAARLVAHTSNTLADRVDGFEAHHQRRAGLAQLASLKSLRAASTRPTQSGTSASLTPFGKGLVLRAICL